CVLWWVAGAVVGSSVRCSGVLRMSVVSEAYPFFFFSSRRRHTRSVSAFLLNRSSDLGDLCLVLLLAVLLLLLLVAPCLNCLEAVKKPPPVAFKVMCLLPITIL